jgi:hypothetical protein
MSTKFNRNDLRAKYPFHAQQEMKQYAEPARRVYNRKSIRHKLRALRARLLNFLRV